MNETGRAVGEAEVTGGASTTEDFSGFQTMGFSSSPKPCVPFVRQNGKLTPLKTLGGANGVANQINNLGLIAGFAETKTVDPNCPAPQVYQFKPVVWSPLGVQSLPTKQDTDGVAYGLREGLEAVRLAPDLEAPYRRVLDAHLCLGRFGDADREAARVREQGIDGARIHQRFLELGYLENDSTAIARDIQRYTGKPDEYLSFGLQAAALNVHGQRHASHLWYQRAGGYRTARGSPVCGR
ncbi:MAG: hypothetical protein WB679_22225 [Terracidiphilus sp.]